MKTWQLAVMSLLWLALAGCRSDPEIARLEQDNRIKEDEIYRLRDQLEECQADLQEAQRRSASQIQRRAQPAPRPGPEQSPAPGGSEPSAAPQPLHNAPPELGNFDGPSVELPKEPLPKGKIPERFQVPRRDPASGATAGRFLPSRRGRPNLEPIYRSAVRRRGNHRGVAPDGQ